MGGSLAAKSTLAATARGAGFSGQLLAALHNYRQPFERQPAITGSLNLDNLNGATKTRMRIIRGEMIAAGMNVT
jgi:hypothetical protein